MFRETRRVQPGLSGSGNLIQGYYSQADTDKLRSKFMIKKGRRLTPLFYLVHFTSLAYIIPG